MLNCRRFVLQLCKKNTTLRSFHNSRLCAANQAAMDENKSTSCFAFKFLKYGLIPAFLATSATLAYATYSYTADEVEEMKTPLAHSANNYRLLLQHKDASSLQKLEASLYSAAVSASIKCIETYVDLRRSIEEQVQGFAEPSSDKLLPDLPPEEQKVLTLVLDLNETLIYTDWKRERGWRTFKRPGAEIFLERLGQYYEIVVYSDQLDMYVNPIVDRLDTKNSVRHRLFRPATRYQNGKHYRDLSKLNRDPSKIIYLSGHALETCLQPENCAPIKPWKLEDGDKELLDMIPFLEFVAIQNYSRYNPPDLRQVLTSYKGYDIATEFNNRQREANEKRNVLLKRIWPSQ